MPTGKFNKLKQAVDVAVRFNKGREELANLLAQQLLNALCRHGAAHWTGLVGMDNGTSCMVCGEKSAGVELRLGSWHQ